MKFTPAASTGDALVEFEVETADGKSCSFTIPKVEYRTRRAQKKIDAWLRDDTVTKDGHDLFIFIVGLYDAKAAKFLDDGDIENGQLNAMMAHYQSESEADEGESGASSDS